MWIPYLIYEKYLKIICEDNDTRKHVIEKGLLIV